MGFPSLPASLFVLGLLPASLAAQCELQALKGRNTVPMDFFGKSTDMDGTNLVVGAFAATSGRPGSAHVFELFGGDWVQTARLNPSDGGGSDEFGNSVGISGDTIVAGSEYHDTAVGSNSGAVYVFQKLGGNWTEVQKLEPHDALAQRNFGEYVAISGDVIVVGNRFDTDLGNNSGAAYVFEKSGGLWQETAKLKGSQGARNDLSADTVRVQGTRIVMASYRADASGGKSGAAYVFDKVNGAWVEKARLVANDRAGELSRGVDLDGDRILLGARRDSTQGTDSGAGYLFELVNGTWQQTAKLVPSIARAGDWSGEAVAISGDRLIVSGHFHDLFGSNSGVATAFERVNGAWVEAGTLVSSAPSPNDNFSFALAMDGNLAVGTSPYEAGNVGAAYVFTFDDALCGCGGTGGGVATPYGEGLGGANIGMLTTADAPNPGANVRFRVTNIPNGTSGFVWLNTRQVAQASLGGTLLTPLSGAPIKLPFRMTLGVGQVTWPVSYSLCGVTMYAQASVIDATQSQGRALTNGLRLDVGQ